MKNGNNSKEYLKQIVSNIQSLQRDRDKISENLRDSFKDAKSSGYNVTVIRKLLKAASDPDKFKLELEEMEIYNDDLQLNLFS